MAAHPQEAQTEVSSAESVTRDSATVRAPLRKKLVRRAVPDYSQVLRRTFQFLFLAMNVWIGVLFYLWVRGFETGSHSGTAVRPAGVDGWLPIEGMMNFKYWLTTGRVPATHPA